MTTAVKPLPAHGTLSRHKYHGCKCQTCYDGFRAYQRTRHRRRGYGTWQPFVDAEPVREHIQHLRGAGLSIARIAEAAGLPVPTIARYLYGCDGRPPTRRARPETAAAVLAVTADAATPGRVPLAGTRRRIQALAAAGWPTLAVAERAGMNRRTIRDIASGRYRDGVYASTAATIARVYRELVPLDPTRHGVRDWVAVKTRRWAAGNGWHGPLAWGEDIDDPAAEPELEPEQPLDRMELAKIRRRDVWLLASAGHTSEAIATRLDMAVTTVRTIRAELATGKRRDRTRQGVAA